MNSPRKGCLPYGLAVAVILVVFVGGGITSYLAYQAHVATTTLTATEPRALSIPSIPVSAADEPRKRLEQFAQGASDAASFSADDLNALIQHDPRFARLKGQAVVSIEGAEAQAEFAFALGTPQGWFATFARVAGKERFLNGSLRLSLPPDSTQAVVHRFELNGTTAPKDNVDWISMVIAKHRAGETEDDRRDELMSLLRFASIRDGKLTFDRKGPPGSQTENPSHNSATPAPSPG